MRPNIRMCCCSAAIWYIRVFAYALFCFLCFCNLHFTWTSCCLVIWCLSFGSISHRWWWWRLNSINWMQSKIVYTIGCKIVSVYICNKNIRFSLCININKDSHTHRKNNSNRKWICSVLIQTEFTLKKWLWPVQSFI